MPIDMHAALLIKKLGGGDASITDAKFDSHVLQEVKQKSESENS